MRRRFDPVTLLIPVGLILAWEIATRTELLDPRFFVPLTTILSATAELAVDGVLWRELSVTLQRLVLAFGAAAVIGTILGLAAGLWRPVYLITQPLVDTLYPLPKIALLPLMIIIVGIGDTAFILTAFATAVFQVMLSLTAGVRDVQPILIEVGRNYGAHGWRFISRVLIPAMMPIMLNAMRLALGLSLITVLAVEFVAARSGLGNLVNLSWQQLQVPQMYAGILVAGLLGYAINLLFRTLDRKLMPWRHTSGRSGVAV